MYWKCSAGFEWHVIGFAIEVFYDTIFEEFVIYIRILGFVFEFNVSGAKAKPRG